MKTFYFIAIGLLLIGCKQGNNSAKQIIENTIADATEKDCIERILDEDSVLGKERNTLCETKSLSETIETYVAGMKQLDFYDCPQDFSKAFKAHIDAWEEMVAITDNYPEMRGEMHDLFKQLEQKKDSVAFKNKLDAIWSSWAIVEERIK